jgi:hypothetical protein
MVCSIDLPLPFLLLSFFPSCSLSSGPKLISFLRSHFDLQLATTFIVTKEPLSSHAVTVFPAKEAWAKESSGNFASLYNQLRQEESSLTRDLVFELNKVNGAAMGIFSRHSETDTANGLTNWSQSDRKELCELLATLQTILLRISLSVGIDMASALADKMKKNRRKYPADRAKGKSAKYTAYINQPGRRSNLECMCIASAAALICFVFTRMYPKPK